MRQNDPDTFLLEEAENLPAEPSLIINALKPLVTAERYARILKVASQRNPSLTLVLDRVSDPHNISAVLRSADAFGVPSLHIIPERNEFRATQGVSKGTQHWVDVHAHSDVNACAKALRALDYQIFVAAMSGDLSLMDLTRRALNKIALVFGNEHRGPNPQWTAHATGFFAIPMRGFVESLNVSVAAAISMFSISQVQSTSQNQKSSETMIARYLWRSVTNPQSALDKYWKANESNSLTQR